MSELFFSVIIPTYQRNDLLALCLERLHPSAQKLSADLYEVVVTDDGRAVTAEEMIKSKFPWVRWVKGPGKGPAANRNNGAQFAKGTWLAFTDDDCLPEEGWLSSFYKASQSVSPITILEGRTTCKKGVVSPLMHAPVNEKGGFLWSCNMAILRQAFMDLDGFDAIFPYPHLEDVDFKDRAIEKGLSLTFVKAAIVDHPPRKYHTFKKLAQTHESEIYYFAKKGKLISWATMCKMVLHVKLRTMYRHPFHKDNLVYFLSTLYELLYITRHIGKWKSKYQEIVH